MTDIVSAEKRSAMMAGIRSKNTRPELIVRSVAHGLGLRYRLHRGDLPGSPDLVLPKHRTAVFVQGCFWHRHAGCKLAYTPKSNLAFWNKKFERNVARDADSEERLRHLGWRVLKIWECETRHPENVALHLRKFFGLRRLRPGAPRRTW
jgi:DNA mismatch endonuclease (patch repair protein)